MLPHMQMKLNANIMIDKRLTISCLHCTLESSFDVLAKSSVSSAGDVV